MEAGIFLTGCFILLDNNDENGYEVLREIHTE